MDQVKLSRFEDEERVLQPFSYMLQKDGDKFRLDGLHGLNYWFKIPSEKYETLKEFLKLLYNSALIMDDIQDFTILRRGRPTTHCVYGIASTIHSVNYVLSKMIKICLDLHPGGADIFLEKFTKSQRGQYTEIYWRDHVICPTEGKYLRMVVNKTGSLAAIAVEIMQLLSANKDDRKLFNENKDDITESCEALTMFAQVRNDYINLCSTQYSLLKGFCEDITEGKFSFPIIHGINSQPDNDELINILSHRTEDRVVKKYFLSVLEKNGSLDYTRNYLNNLKEKIEKQSENFVAKFGSNPYLTNFKDFLFTMEE